MPTGSSPCVDLLFELCEASDDGIEGRRLAAKHSTGNHLFIIDSKSFEKIGFWNKK
jgi:hypothetical protein